MCPPSSNFVRYGGSRRSFPLGTYRSGLSLRIPKRGPAIARKISGIVHARELDGPFEAALVIPVELSFLDPRPEIIGPQELRIGRFRLCKTAASTNVPGKAAIWVIRQFMKGLGQMLPAAFDAMLVVHVQPAAIVHEGEKRPLVEMVGFGDDTDENVLDPFFGKCTGKMVLVDQPKIATGTAHDRKHVPAEELGSTTRYEMSPVLALACDFAIPDRHLGRAKALELDRMQLGLDSLLQGHGSAPRFALIDFADGVGNAVSRIAGQFGKAGASEYPAHLVMGSCDPH